MNEAFVHCSGAGLTELCGSEKAFGGGLLFTGSEHMVH
jgi:hypothetical protein